MGTLLAVRTPYLASFSVLSLFLLLSGCPTDVPPVDAPSPEDAGADAPPDGGVPCSDDPLQDACLPAEPTYDGPSAPVEILRDANGVPHVYGETDADAYFGSGYMQATDRLLQMELTRRRALGRRAEVLGESYVDDDRTLRIMNIPRWAELNRRQMLVEEPAQYELVQAWVAGINRRIDEVTAGTAPLPVGFSELDFMPEHWSIADGFAVGKLILFGNANLIEYEVLASVIRQYLPTLDAMLPLLQPMQDTFILPPEERPARAITHEVEGALPHVPTADRPDLLGANFPERFATFRETLHGGLGARGASNNWAVDGRHTENGRPLIAGDPHQGLDSPSLMWMHHINSADAGGTLDVNGFAFVGTPSVQLGHNRDLAWTATTTYPDWMDLWSVRHDAVANTVVLGTDTLPVVIRREEIRVRGEAAPRVVEIEDVARSGTFTGGVLLPDDFFPIALDPRPRRRVLFSWTGFRPTHEAQGFHGFNVASTRDEYDAAADRNELGAFNFLAADATGITYRSSPLTPVRNEAVGGVDREPWIVRDGDQVGTLWTLATFLVDGTTLPHSRGGTRGWIATANNEPFGFMNDGRAAGDAFYFGVFFDPGTRAHRIESELTRLLERPEPLTRADMQALQDDTHNEVADALVPALTAAWDGRAGDASLASLRDRPDLLALVERLRSWDRRMERTSSDAVVFNAYAHFLARGVLSDELSLVFEPILSSSAMFVLKLLVIVLEDESYFDEGRSFLLVNALSETAAWLEMRFGGIEASRYTWADYHFTCFSGLAGVAALEGGCTATDGGIGTVNVSDSAFFESGAITPRMRTESHGGSIYRLVAEFDASGRPHAFVNVPRGNSGDPDSPHWDDLHADWTENVYRELLFDRAEIEASAAGPGGGGTITLAP